MGVEVSALIGQVLPYLISALAGVASAAIGGLLLTANRLRAQIISDITIADHLVLKHKALVNEHIRARTLRLLAIEKYPGFTLLDLLRLVVITGMVALGISVAWSYRELPKEYLNPAEWFLVAAGWVGVVPAMFFGILIGHLRRQRGRQLFLESHGLRADAVEADFALRSRSIASSLAAIAVLLAAPGYILWTLVERFGRPEWAVLALSAGMAFSSLGLFVGVSITVDKAAKAEVSHK